MSPTVIRKVDILGGGGSEGLRMKGLAGKKKGLTERKFLRGQTKVTVVVEGSGIACVDEKCDRPAKPEETVNTQPLGVVNGHLKNNKEVSLRGNRLE